jgi:ribonuclease VapC
MVIDSSAIIGIILLEPEAKTLAEAFRLPGPKRMSAVTYLEATLVLEGRQREEGRSALETWVRESGTEIIPFDLRQLLYASQGWREFGKGRHPAALNLGDCATYALVKVTGEPLLCKGNDFAQTDIAHLILR